MSRIPPAAPEKPVMKEFIDAVLAVSEDPASVNVQRYLVASRALEDSRQRLVARSAVSRRTPAVRRPE